MKLPGKGLAALILLLACSTSAGCLLVAAGAGAGVGIGAAEYIRGELKQTYAASIEKTWNASLSAAQEMKMKVTEKSIDNMDQNRWIRGKTDEGRDFQIQLESLGKDVTIAKVRIGVFGDENYSKRIQDLIARNLKT